MKKYPLFYFTLAAVAAGLIFFVLQWGLIGVQINRFQVEYYGLFIAITFTGLGYLWWCVFPKREVKQPVSLTPGQQPQELTQREWEILQALQEGLTNKQLAAKLFVSENTIKTHLAGLYTKLQVTNRTQAVTQGIKKGWISSIQTND